MTFVMSLGNYTSFHYDNYKIPFWMETVKSFSDGVHLG